MPFIPHTEADVADMLKEIGADGIPELFDEIPAHLQATSLEGIPSGMSELKMVQELSSRASRDEGYACFLGAGSYDHHVPAAVWDLASRGEFLTAYTPYQAEASQGTLQLIYEYQSMMSTLTAMEFSNASVYDGASGLAESVLMAVRANKKNKSRRVLVSGSANPNYIKAAKTIVGNQKIKIDVSQIGQNGLTEVADYFESGEAPVALVIQHPNFFGCLEEIDDLTDLAHANGSMVIAVVNPMTLSVLRPPGTWGETGADIVCGDGQPFGIPMASGGPSFGFICCKKEFVRQLPGRIIGRTEDSEGRIGYTLTLQAREQHIRRDKATSNICTNQGLLVTAGTIYLSLMGPTGLRATLEKSYENANLLRTKLLELDGVEPFFPRSTSLHEFTLKLPIESRVLVQELLEHKILAGIEMAPFSSDLPDAENGLIIAVTEKRTRSEIEDYVKRFSQVLARQVETV